MIRRVFRFIHGEMKLSGRAESISSPPGSIITPTRTRCSSSLFFGFIVASIKAHTQPASKRIATSSHAHVGNIEEILLDSLAVPMKEYFLESCIWTEATTAQI